MPMSKYPVRTADIYEDIHKEYYNFYFYVQANVVATTTF